MGHRSVFHCVAAAHRCTAACQAVHPRMPSHPRQPIAHARTTVRSDVEDGMQVDAFGTFEHSARSLKSAAGMPVCAFKMVVFLQGLVGNKTWIDSREIRQTPTACSMSNCTAPGPGVQSRRFASGSNLPDGIFSGRSATGDGAALSVENGRRFDGCRPPTQTSSGMYGRFPQGSFRRNGPELLPEPAAGRYRNR